MQKSFNQKYQRPVYELFAGEYLATQEKRVILTTLLGSCVSACLMDRVSGVSGMNHFLLPGDFRREDIIFSPDAKYGMYAMEILINEMIKKGADRNRLEAKVFGGGHVLEGQMGKVSENNVMFIQAYMAMEGIPVRAESLGGTKGRKVVFFPDTGDIYVRNIDPNQVYQRDRQFLQRVKQKTRETGSVTLFE